MEEKNESFRKCLFKRTPCFSDICKIMLNEILNSCKIFEKRYSEKFENVDPLFLIIEGKDASKSFLPTTIQPTLLPFHELYEYQACSTFVADFIKHQELESKNKLPNVIAIPEVVIKSRVGNSLEISSVLCSLLIGAGYRAYVVLGSAKDHILTANQQCEVCPYSLKTAISEAGDAENDIEQKYETINKDSEYGLHFWVTVLPGSRKVSEQFFIESTTGVEKKISDKDYGDVKSIWNHENCWIKLKKGSCFDLDNKNDWLNVLPETRPKDQNCDEIMPIHEGMNCTQEDIFLMSDRKAFTLSSNEFENRFQEGSKVTSYYKVRLEMCNENAKKDQLKRKFTQFQDESYENLVETTENFYHRSDRLVSRFTDHRNDEVFENFGKGRMDQLKEHRFTSSASGTGTQRQMRFYHTHRSDGLERRVISDVDIYEDFVGRSDLLVSRSTRFKRREKEFGPRNGDRRQFLFIEEKFESQVEDGSLRIYDFLEDTITIYFDSGDNAVCPPFVKFSKHLTEERDEDEFLQKEDFGFSAESSEYFNPNPDGDELSMLNQKILFMKYSHYLQEAIKSSRLAEKETIEILQKRDQEELNKNFL